MLKGDGKGNFKATNEKESGIFVNGQVRNIEMIKAGKKELAIFARNNEPLKIFDFAPIKNKTIAVKH